MEGGKQFFFEAIIRTNWLLNGFGLVFKPRWQKGEEEADSQAVSSAHLHGSKSWRWWVLLTPRPSQRCSAPDKQDGSLFVPLCGWIADVSFERSLYALQSDNVASAVPEAGLKALKFAEKHAASGTTRLAPHKVNTCMKTNKILEYEAEAKECLHLFPSSNYFVNLKDGRGDLTPFLLYRSNTCHRRHPS